MEKDVAQNFNPVSYIRGYRSARCVKTKEEKDNVRISSFGPHKGHGKLNAFYSHVITLQKFLLSR